MQTAISHNRCFVVALIALTFAASILPAQSDTTYTIYRAASAPLIDGAMDSVWKSVPCTFQRSYDNGATPPDSYSDLMGWSRMMWDDVYLYGLHYTQDDIIVDSHANWWERDGWELYFDGNNGKESTFDGVNDIQIAIPHGATESSDLIFNTYGWSFNDDGMEFINLDDANGLGYWMEWKIPLANLSINPLAGINIGLEIAQNDNDGSSCDHLSRWWLEDGISSWNNPSTWGTAILSDQVSDGRAHILYTSSAPVIDGVLDEVWKTGSRRISANRFGNSGIWPDDYSDLYGEYRLMWDDENLYGFFTAWDEIIQDTHANSWERDGFDIYFDADNSKSIYYDGVNDYNLRITHGYTLPSEIDAQSYFDRTGVDFINHDTDTGWNLEFKIPLSGLQIQPVLGSQIGFEAHQNDNDGTAREHISKWWVDTGDPSWNNPSTFGTAYLTGVDESQFGGLAGTVYERDGTTPVSSASVKVYNSGWTQVRSTTTNSGGYYTVGGLTAGNYYVHANGSVSGLGQVYIGEYYNQSQDQAGADAVVVAAADTSLGINFTLDLLGSMSGTVYESDGTTPVSSASIIVYDSGWTQVTRTTTNSGGQFTVGGLTAGDYYGYADGTVSGMGQVYLGEYYDNSPDQTGAHAVAVAASDTASDVDFTLDKLGGLSGYVFADDGATPVSAVTVTLYDSGWGIVQTISTNASGLYEFSSLMPGSYYTHASSEIVGSIQYIGEYYNDSPDQAGADAITVNIGATTSGIDFLLTDMPYTPSVPSDTLFTIYRAAISPLIDGQMDSVWKSVPCTFQRSYDNSGTAPSGYSDLMGWTRMMWDDTYLYGLSYTQDDVLVDSHENFYERDGWEYYFDGDNSKTVGFYDDVDDIHLAIPHGISSVDDIIWLTDEGNSSWTFDTSVISFQNYNDPNGLGYWLEWRIPLLNLAISPTDGSVFGFEAGQNDNDGTTREHISKWWAEEGDPSWNNPSTWGTAILSDQVSDGRAYILHTATAPVVDGVLDDVWKTSSRKFSINRFGNGPILPDDYTDLYGEFRLMWDDQNLYGFFTTWDDIVQDNHPNTYERDGWDLYFDANYSRGDSYDNLDDTNLRIAHGFALPSEIDAPPYFSRDGMEFVNEDTDTGWNLEFKIPLAGLQIDPISGSQIGFETHQNDNDSDHREHIAKWWLDFGDNSWNNPSVFGTAYLTGGDESQQYGGFTGTVYENNGTTPIASANLVVYNSGWSQVRTTISNSSGQYAVGGLTAGNYYVYANGVVSGQGSVFIPEYYNNSPDRPGADAVVVAESDTSSGIDFILDRLGAISGTVYEDNGTTPISAVAVTLYNGVWETVQTSSTNVSGQYQFSSLTPGSYYAQASSRIIGSIQFVGEYFNDSPDQSGADAVTVSVGTTTSGVNFLLSDTPYEPSVTADSLFTIYLAAVPPLIDGQMDNVWKSVPCTFQRSYDNSGTAPDGFWDLMGWTRMMWDDSYLYGLSYTQDDVLSDSDPNWWGRDGWWYFLDGDNSKGSTNPSHNFDTVNDVWICFPHGATAFGDLNINTNSWSFSTSGMQFQNVDDPSGLGYWLEWRIPLANLGISATDGTLIGFEAHQNDNDGVAREHISKWWAEEGDESWRDVSVWGTAILSDQVSDGRTYVLHTAIEPTIDGQMDDVWREGSRRISTNYFGIDLEWPDSYEDLYGEYRLMWDDYNLYGLLTVWDDIIIDTHANPWEQDGADFYFDGDYSKGTAYDGLNDVALRINHGNTLPSDITGYGAMNVTGVEFANLDTDIGWTLEFKIPLMNLSIDPVSGTLFGFDAHQNDNDSNKRDHLAAWWENGNESWHDPSVFGTAVLEGGETNRVIARIKTFLSGAYQAAGTMTTTLRTAGYIPLRSPYPDTLTVVSIPSGVTDWVSVELRTASDAPASVQRSFFLKADGTVVDTDGTTTDLDFDGMTAGSYFIVVRHRNHGIVMSDSAVALGPASPVVYDFSEGSDRYYGSGGAKQVETGVWGMWAGDVNQDKNVTTTDYTSWYNSARLGESGYKATDINLDGVVTTSDYTIWYNNARLGAASQVP